MEQIKLSALPKMRQQMNIWNQLTELNLSGRVKANDNRVIFLSCHLKGKNRKNSGYTMTFGNFLSDKKDWKYIKFAISKNELYFSRCSSDDSNALRLSGINYTLTNRSLVEFIIDFTGHIIPTEPGSSIKLFFDYEMVSDNVYKLKLK